MWQYERILQSKNVFSQSRGKSTERTEKQNVFLRMKTFIQNQQKKYIIFSHNNKYTEQHRLVAE